MNDTIFVGLDVHKVAIAVAEGMRGGEVRQLGAILHRADALAKLVEKLGRWRGSRPPEPRRPTISVPMAGGGARWGNLVPCYEPALPTLAP